MEQSLVKRQTCFKTGSSFEEKTRKFLDCEESPPINGWVIVRVGNRGVGDGVMVGVGVFVGVNVGLGVRVGVGVADGVGLAVGVALGTAVGRGVLVGPSVGRGRFSSGGGGGGNEFPPQVSPQEQEQGHILLQAW